MRYSMFFFCYTLGTRLQGLGKKSNNQQNSLELMIKKNITWDKAL